MFEIAAMGIIVLLLQRIMHNRKVRLMLAGRSDGSTKHDTK